jgi:hypothetical protein
MGDLLSCIRIAHPPLFQRKARPFSGTAAVWALAAL